MVEGCGLRRHSQEPQKSLLREWAVDSGRPPLNSGKKRRGSGWKNKEGDLKSVEICYDQGCSGLWLNTAVAGWLRTRHPHSSARPNQGQALPLPSRPRPQHTHRLALPLQMSHPLHTPRPLPPCVLPPSSWRPAPPARGPYSSSTPRPLPPGAPRTRAQNTPSYKPRLALWGPRPSAHVR